MSQRYLEGLVRRSANRFGLDVKRHDPRASEAARLSTMLAFHGVDLVLDVGANTGQFARGLRATGYTGRMISFEPLSTAHAELVRVSKRDPRWEIATRSAIGDRDGETTIHISENSVSSSLLDMLDSHTNAAPGSAYIGDEVVSLARLDTAALDYMRPESVSFLKIDTQGYEDRVLNGATSVLSQVRGLQLELSFVPLYGSQLLFEALTERMRALGFSIWAIWPGFCDPPSGRMLQVDATFFRD